MLPQVVTTKRLPAGRGMPKSSVTSAKGPTAEKGAPHAAPVGRNAEPPLVKPETLPLRPPPMATEPLQAVLPCRWRAPSPVLLCRRRTPPPFVPIAAATRAATLTSGAYGESTRGTGSSATLTLSVNALVRASKKRHASGLARGRVMPLVEAMVAAAPVWYAPINP